MTGRMGLYLGTAILLLASAALSASIDGGEVTAPAHAGTAGTIAGSIRYAGAAPQRPVLQMAADPYCVTAHADQEVLSEQVVVNDNDTLRWTFVRIRESAAASLGGGEPGTVVLDQVGCMYTPRVVGMQAGGTIRVVNSDQTLHNVNVQPRNNPGFNVAQPIPGMATERVFDNPEVMIPVRCDVHPWMQAYIGVVEHAYFDVSGEDGSFRLEGVPPGAYVLEAWHESLGTQTLNVTVGDGATATADFIFGSDR